MNRVLFFIVFLLLIAAYNLYPAKTTTIAADTGIKHQTISGWGASSWIPSWMPDGTKDDLLTEAVFSLGLNRLRLEPPKGNSAESRRWEWFNDDQDPYNLRKSELNAQELDKIIKRVFKPFRDRVNTRGDKFSFYILPSFFNYGTSGEIPVWLMESPGEYTEYAMSLLNTLKNDHSFEADYYCILNEPGIYNEFNSSLTAEMIRNLGPAMRNAGLKTKIQYPEAASPETSWEYILDVMSDDSVMKYIGLFSYQLYGDRDPFREKIKYAGISNSIPTAQTEYISLSIRTLYDDLTLGGTSIWEIYSLNNCLPFNFYGISHSSQFWSLRQVMYYARQGSTRIEAISDDNALRTLAFMLNGKMTLVMINDTVDRNVTINNILPGEYCSSTTTNRYYYQENGVFTVEGNTCNVFLPASSVMTIYPHDMDNLPPVAAYWFADKEYLLMPDSTLELSVYAEDPESDSLYYTWTVEYKPEKAKIIFDNFRSQFPKARGLTVPGEYVFNVGISDGKARTNKRVRVAVFDRNQAPVTQDVGNRIPVVITLPQDSTYLGGYGIDIERDNLKYKYTILDQPEGADATIDALSKGGWIIRNMSVPGDYKLEFSVSDSLNTTRDTLHVPVYPANVNAPIIEYINSSKDTLFLPDNEVMLSAATHDNDGDSLTHWWYLKSAPFGAKPVFSKPGLKETKIRNIKLAGEYVFALKVMDRTRKSEAEKIVIVTNGTSAGAEPGLSYVRCSPNPAIDQIIFSFFDYYQGTVLLTVTDLLGNTITEFKEVLTDAGIHSISIELNGYSTGVYNYKLQHGSDIMLGKFMVIK